MIYGNGVQPGEQDRVVLTGIKNDDLAIIEVGALIDHPAIGRRHHLAPGRVV